MEAAIASETLLPIHQSARHHTRDDCHLQQHFKSQCYDWKKSNMKVRNWTTELKEELYNMGVSCAWRKQQECNLTEIRKIVKNRCNDIERSNILAKLSEKSSWGKGSYIEWCSSVIAWLLAGVWQLRGIRRYT